MDKITNPFSPGAGSPPPELAGRESVLNQVEVLLGRVKAKRSEKSILLTGLCGVGKTVLLNAIEKMAIDSGYRTILIEAHESKSLTALLTPQLKNILYSIDRMAGIGQKAKKGLSILKSFINSVKLTIGDVDIGLDIDPEDGYANSGDLELDLSALFLAIGEAAEEKQTSIAILIDEIQYFSSQELSALVMAMHKMQQKQLPIILIGAGLPILPALVGDSKTYAERLFSFPNVGALSRQESYRALQDPVKDENESFSDDALNEIYIQTKGYPYFLQEWGYQAWNYAQCSPISLDVVKASSELVSKRLDENFFRVRFDRLTPKEKTYLRAMAELSATSCRTSDIAQILKVKVNTLGPVRANLIKKGMVYSPVHGETAFTVPLFDEFMRRSMAFTV